MKMILNIFIIRIFKIYLRSKLNSCKKIQLLIFSYISNSNKDNNNNCNRASNNSRGHNHRDSNKVKLWEINRLEIEEILIFCSNSRVSSKIKLVKV